MVYVGFYTSLNSQRFFGCVTGCSVYKILHSVFFYFYLVGKCITDSSHNFLGDIYAIISIYDNNFINVLKHFRGITMADKEQEVLEQLDNMLETIKSIMNSLSSIDKNMKELHSEFNGFNGVFEKGFSEVHEKLENIIETTDKVTVQ